MATFTQKKLSDLTEEQLLNNIALLEAGKVDLQNTAEADKLIAAHYAELLKRGYDDETIDMKLKDIAGSLGDINSNSNKGGFWDVSEKGIGLLDQATDVGLKLKGFFTKGDTVQDGKSEYDIVPGYDEKPFNWKPYAIGGGALVVLTVVLLVVTGKKK